MTKRNILLLILVILVIIGGCSLEPGIDNNATPAVSESQDLSRGSCPSSPQTKIVTVIVNMNKTYALDSIGLAAITNGALSRSYDDGCYDGILHSTGYTVTGPPTINGNYITFNLDVTFQGLVQLDLCAGQPASIVVTQLHNINITYSVYSIGLNAINNGALSWVYSTTCYYGILRSTSYRVTGPPTINGTYITFNLDVTYSATVYKR